MGLGWTCLDVYVPSTRRGTAVGACTHDAAVRFSPSDSPHLFPPVMCKFFFFFERWSCASLSTVFTMWVLCMLCGCMYSSRPRPPCVGRPTGTAGLYQRRSNPQYVQLLQPLPCSTTGPQQQRGGLPKSSSLVLRFLGTGSIMEHNISLSGFTEASVKIEVTLDLPKHHSG